MGNLFGVSPKWVSKDQAGGNPAYPKQTNSDLKLEKDLDIELSIFESWKKLEGLFKIYSNDNFSDGDRAALSRVGRPILVSVGSTGKSQSFSTELGEGLPGVVGSDIYTNWVEDGNNGYLAKIPYRADIWGGHRKGFIVGGLEDLDESRKSAFIIPKVRTYNYAGSVEGEYVNTGDQLFEEVYDSAEVNIRTGDITLRSKSTSVYLVVVY